MNQQKRDLLSLGSDLYALGQQLDQIRRHIQSLKAAGVDSESMVMFQALAEYEAVREKWEEKEQAYLRLKERIKGT